MTWQGASHLVSCQPRGVRDSPHMGAVANVPCFILKILLLLFLPVIRFWCKLFAWAVALLSLQPCTLLDRKGLTGFSKRRKGLVWGRAGLTHDVAFPCEVCVKPNKVFCKRVYFGLMFGIRLRGANLQSDFKTRDEDCGIEASSQKRGDDLTEDSRLARGPAALLRAPTAQQRTE